MSNGLKSLEDQFYDTASLCFANLKTAEDALTNVKAMTQRLFAIENDLSKLRNGKMRAGRTASLKRSARVRRVVRGFMALLAIVPLYAADPVPQKYTMISSNWSMAVPPRPTTNGFSPAWEYQTRMTNTSLLYKLPDGREECVAVSSVAGPIVGKRTNAYILPPIHQEMLMQRRTR